MIQFWGSPILLVIFLLAWPCPSRAVTLHIADDTEIQIRSKTHSTSSHRYHKHSKRDYRDDSRDSGTITIHHSRHGTRSLGLVKFDLSPLLPDSRIERAILRMWISELDREGLLNFHEVLENWEEKTFGVKDVPPLGPVFHSVPIDKADEDKFLTVEVTTIVQGWLDSPAANFGFALVSDEAQSVHVEFDSKENLHTSHPMEIEVTLAPGIGPEGPQGQQGPKGDQGPQGPTGPAVQLLLLGQHCQPGEFLTGFDAAGNILCGAPPADNPPLPSGVNDADPGDVIITEIMSNPNAVNDTDGEWFEIFNTRAATIDIAGWSIEDGSASHLIPASNPILIASGEFLVLGNNANTTANGGIAVAYQYAGITLNNSGDAITLSDVNNEEIDRVDYGLSFTIPSAGISLNLDPNHFNGNDNDDGSFWCPSTTLIGSGPDTGTPGAANEVCPSVP